MPSSLCSVMLLHGARTHGDGPTRGDVSQPPARACDRRITQAHGRPHHAAERAWQRLDLRSIDSARRCRRQGERTIGLHRAGSDRSIDHAGGGRRASRLRRSRDGCSAGAARPAWSRIQRWRGRCCRSGPGTPCCSTTPSARAKPRRWPKPRAPMRRSAIVLFTPATRHELQSAASSAFTGYLIKPLRAASLATRLTCAGRSGAAPCRRSADRCA